MSAALGVRDANEASWTQVLDVLEFMADATDAPILMDGDTGFGNFNNVSAWSPSSSRAAWPASAWRRHSCFRRPDSFLHGVRAATWPRSTSSAAASVRPKDDQRDPDFVVVARIEAFIAGHGLGRRAEACAWMPTPGADAILIHSAKRTPDEVLSFKQAWGRPLPVLAVPTRMRDTPTPSFAAIDLRRR